MTRPSYKERKAFDVRQMEVDIIRTKYPQKIPVIAERHKKERHLQQLEKTKYLVPQDMSLGQFTTILRNRLYIGSSQAFYTTIAGKNMPTMTLTMAEVYDQYVDDDGFLYLNYTSEDIFG